MYRIIKWGFIPMFLKRLIYKRYRLEVEGLDILTRLDIELKMFAAYTFEQYSVRSASAVKVNVFTQDIQELSSRITIMESMLMEDSYVSEKWKKLKFSYGSLSIDEFFSTGGYDIRPERNIPLMIESLKAICIRFTEFTPTKRTYYLRHTKPVLEDSIEIISRLRSML